MILIRPADKRDDSPVLNLFLACCEDDAAYLPAVLRTLAGVRAWFNLKTVDYLWVAVRGDAEVLAVAGLTLHPPPAPMGQLGPEPWGELCRFAIDPTARGLGIGRALTNAVLDYSGRHGIQSLWLRCVSDSPAEKFYTHLGWAQVGQTSFDPPHDVQTASILARTV